MKHLDRRHALALAFCASLPLIAVAAGEGDHGDHSGHAGGDHSEGSMESMARYGGKMMMAGEHHFEVTFDDSGIHVFPMDSFGDPILSPQVAGKVIIRSRRGKPASFDLEPMRDESGRVSALMLSKDFSKVRDGTRKAFFEVSGLGEARKFSLILRRSAMDGQSGAHSSHAGSHSANGGSHSSHEATSGGASAAERVRAARERRQRERGTPGEHGDHSAGSGSHPGMAGSSHSGHNH